MPDLDFPSSPTTGTQYSNWVYNGAQWDFAQTLPGGLPAGSIIQWGGATAPVNWLLCDGSAVSRTTYASLFAAVGTAYGTGDGTTTFNLPDLRGRVPVGKNAATFGTLGATGGTETNTLTANNLPAHNHPVTDPGHNHSQAAHYHGTNNYNGGGNTQGRPTTNAGAHGDSNYWNFYGNVGYSSVEQPYIYPNTTGITVGNNSTTNSAVNNLQPYQVVNYIIKATAAITPGESELAPRVGVLEATNALSHNYLINGAMEIWQRGTSFTVSTGTYTADRWLVDNGTVTRQPSGLSGIPYCLQIANAAGNPALRQGVELPAVGVAGQFAIGTTWTVSFYAKVSTTISSNMALYVAFADGTFGGNAVQLTATSTLGVPTTSWTRYSWTFTVGSAPAGTNLALSIVPYLSSGSYAGNFSVTGVQLEAGSIATAFRRNSPNVQAELLACKRYYQQQESLYSNGTNGGFNNSYFGSRPYEVEMRVGPTLTLYPDANFGGTAGQAIFYPGGTRAVPTFEIANSKMFEFQYNGVSNYSLSTFSYKAQAEL